MNWGVGTYLELAVISLIGLKSEGLDALVYVQKENGLIETKINTNYLTKNYIKRLKNQIEIL